METADKLLAMKKEVEEAQTKKARLEGELDSVKAQLKSLGLASVEEAKAETKRLDKEISSKEEELESLIQNLESAYDWKYKN